MTSESSERWTRLWREIGAKGDGISVYHELVSFYSESHRRYHNLRHVADCLKEFDPAKHLAQQPLAIEAAIWFHDAIYNTHAPDNEEKSAELAKKRLSEAGVITDLKGSVAALVMATKTHDSSLHRDAPLLVDIDLSIFGKSEERFWEYENQIRREYDWVPSETFAIKRAEILERFLARPRIYSTKEFFDSYEKQARVNLHASIQKLRNRGA